MKHELINELIIFCKRNSSSRYLPCFLKEKKSEILFYKPWLFLNMFASFLSIKTLTQVHDCRSVIESDTSIYAQHHQLIWVNINFRYWNVIKKKKDTWKYSMCSKNENFHYKKILHMWMQLERNWIHVDLSYETVI